MANRNRKVLVTGAVGQAGTEPVPALRRRLGPGNVAAAGHRKAQVGRRGSRPKKRGGIAEAAVSYDDCDRLPGPFRRTTSKTSDMIEATNSTVLVDGNNVMGSRPDGWWRNRAEAAHRLVAELIPLARSTGSAWTIVFDGPEPPGLVPPHECLTVVHTEHRCRDGADDRIVELVGALPNPAAAVVYTSDVALRARVHALGAEVAGARALLDAIAAMRSPGGPKPTGAVHRRRCGR